MNKGMKRFVIAFVLLGVALVFAAPSPGHAQTRHPRTPGANGQAPSSAPGTQPPPAAPAQAPAPAPNAAASSGMATTSKSSGGEEFFITTSVDAAKHQLVLKRPTEVTLLIQTNDQTAITGENGEHLNVSDLRTGDTVFVTFKASTNPPLAQRIRKAPMTVAELHRRYLNY